MKYFYYLLIIVFVFSCKKETQKTTTSDIEDKAVEVDSSNTDISAISTKDFTEFKVLDSKYINVDNFWKPFNKDLEKYIQ